MLPATAIPASDAGPTRIAPMSTPTIEAALQADGELPLSADLAEAVTGWLLHLEQIRGYSPHTLAAYERDVRQFLVFLRGHLQHPPALADLARLPPKTFRAEPKARSRLTETSPLKANLQPPTHPRRPNSSATKMKVVRESW